MKASALVQPDDTAINQLTALISFYENYTAAARHPMRLLFVF